MKNRFFNTKLFLEGMRQLKIAGLIAAMLLGMECILIPVGTLLSENITVNGVYLNLNIWNMNPGAYLIIVLAPFLILWIFHFLTQRNASDFYHSIPCSRECLYLSFVTAVLVWCLILQWGSSILSMLLHLIMIRKVSFDLPLILIQNLIISMTIVFVIGGSALAVSMTGTFFTNVVVTGVILFAPRLIMNIIRSSVGDSLSVVVSGKYLEFLGNGWNVLTGITIGLWYESSLAVLSSLRAGIYTMSVGLLYLLIGMAVFKRRKSEMAGTTGNTPLLQLVFRLSYAFIFCMFPNIEVFEWMTGRTFNITLDSIYQVCVMYLIGGVIYMLYEMVASRNWKRVIRSAPGLLVLVFLNLLTIFGMYGMQRQVLSYCPDASQITGVALIEEETVRNYYDNNGNTTTYYGYLTHNTMDVILTDPELIELVANRLHDSVEVDLDPHAVEYSNTSTEMKAVKIYCGSSSKYRRIRVSTADLNKIVECLLKNEKYQEVYMKLPDVNDENLLVDSELSAEDSLRMYEALKEDVQDMGFKEWYSYCSSYVNYANYFCNLQMLYKEGMNLYGSSFPITEKTPKAAQVYMDIQSDNQEESQTSILMVLEQLKEDEEYYKNRMSIDWCNYSFNSQQLVDGQLAIVNGEFLDMENTQNLDILMDAIREQQGKSEIRIDGSYMTVYVYHQYSLPLDADLAKPAYDLMEKYSNTDGSACFSYDSWCYINLDELKPETLNKLMSICNTY